MDIKELDGNYEVSIMADGAGVYSKKSVTIKHMIKNGIITGTDEYGVAHSGTLTPIDEDHVAFSIAIDPLGNSEIITTLENGRLTNEAQIIKGTYKVSRKDDKIMLTTMQERGGTTGIITCKKVS